MEFDDTGDFDFCGACWLNERERDERETTKVHVLKRAQIMDVGRWWATCMVLAGCARLQNLLQYYNQPAPAKCRGNLPPRFQNKHALRTCCFPRGSKSGSLGHGQG
jgi:hypothetical protein